jgi:HPt (histidine-containing phosphotransfer) domain-containing protein
VEVFRIWFAVLCLALAAVIGFGVYRRRIHRVEARREAAVLDPSYLESLHRLEAAAGKKIVGEIVERYLAESPRRLARMREALASGDTADLRFVAHSLKGSSAQIGAVTVAEKCQEIERRAAGGTLEGAGALLDDIDRELGRVAVALGS